MGIWSIEVLWASWSFGLILRAHKGILLWKPARMETIARFSELAASLTNQHDAWKNRNSKACGSLLGLQTQQSQESSSKRFQSPLPSSEHKGWSENGLPPFHWIINVNRDFSPLKRSWTPWDKAWWLQPNWLPHCPSPNSTASLTHPHPRALPPNTVNCSHPLGFCIYSTLNSQIAVDCNTMFDT